MPQMAPTLWFLIFNTIIWSILIYVPISYSLNKFQTKIKMYSKSSNFPQKWMN